MARPRAALIRAAEGRKGDAKREPCSDLGETKRGWQNNGLPDPCRPFAERMSGRISARHPRRFPPRIKQKALAHLPPLCYTPCMQTTVPSSGTGHFRRYHGYDYSRGAAMFLSFNVEPKEDVLGSIVAPGVLVHNAWGEMVERKL